MGLLQSSQVLQVRRKLVVMVLQSTQMIMVRVLQTTQVMQSTMVVLQAHKAPSAAASTAVHANL